MLQLICYPIAYVRVLPFIIDYVLCKDKFSQDRTMPSIFSWPSEKIHHNLSYLFCQTENNS